MTTALVLAGGLGTRLRTVVPDLPKPMATVNGRRLANGGACLVRGAAVLLGAEAESNLANQESH